MGGNGQPSPQQKAMSAAAAQARSSGKPVVVDALTTETQQVSAQPHGGFTATIAPAPVRTSHNGQWVPVDTSLHANPDGTLAPAATAYGSVRFSGGGTTPLISTTSGGTTYTLSWPGSLPKPTVSGPNATYHNVLPAVDLQVSATITGGFSDVLIVHTAAAAKNPALKTVTLNGAVGGGTVSSRPGSPLTVVGRGGSTLAASTPLMWDSAASTPTGAQPAHGQTAPSTPVVPDPSDATHPGSAAHVAVVGTRISGASLSLVPDTRLLAASSTRFPVYVDPTAQWQTKDGSGLGYGEVKQGAPCNDVSLWNNDTPDAGNNGMLGVGYNNWPNSRCYGFERTYLQWDLPPEAAGATIQDATVKATKVYSADCQDTTTARMTWVPTIPTPPGAPEPSLSWDSQPQAMQPGYSVTTPVGPACSNGTAPASFDVQAAVANDVSGGAGQFTVELSDANESARDDHMLSRFAAPTSVYIQEQIIPTLTVTFNHPPNLPDQLSARSGSDVIDCATSQPYPYMGATIVSHPVALAAVLTDPDGDAVQANFRYWVGNSAPQPGSSAPGLPSGSLAQFSPTFDPALQNGQVVNWQVQASDGSSTSAWSPVCSFIAEPTGPGQPSITSADGVYPNTDTGGTASARPGVSGQFTLSAPSSTTTSLVYALDQPPSTVNPLASQIVSTYTGGTAPGRLTDRWELADGSGTTGSDPTGNNPVTLSATGASWANGPTPEAEKEVLSFDGTNGYAATSKPVVSTIGSYSVSAWVKLSNTNGYATVVSQGGNNAASFYLQYSKAANAWAFVSPSSDSGNAAAYPIAAASSPPGLNIWTNLVGVYDAGTGAMTLYVNGQLAGSATNNTPWTGTGPLAIGGVKLAGASSGLAGNYFPGSISDVQVYSRALSPTDAAAVYAGVPATGTLSDRWSLSNGTGTVATDPTGNLGATLSTAGASWSDDPARGSNVLALDGVQGYAATSRPVLNTTTSYSVSAWVKLSNTNGYATAVSQGGSNAASFYLQYSKAANAWAFVSPSSDSGDAAAYPIAAASSPPALDTWTNLLGVYDASDSTMSLYVNGALAGTATNASTWNAQGPMAIGGVKLVGAAGALAGNYFPGSIADVQTYTRALTASEASGIYNNANVTITPPSPGPHTLYAYARDAADNTSASTAYHFLVAADPNTTCASLSACFNNTAISDNSDTTLGAYAATAGPVLNTTGSYSVTAWVKLTSLGSYATAVSEGGTNAASFYLQYSAGANAWAFVSPSSDSGNASSYPIAQGSAPPALNAWTHLAGVFDASTGTMSLYINGSLAGTATNPTPWNATGPLAIGGVKLAGGGSNNYFPGSISDVQTYARALTAADIATIVSGSTAATPADRWQLTDTTGTTATDPTGNHPATLSSNATWGSDPSRSHVLALAGSTGADGADSLSAQDLSNAGWKPGQQITINGATFTLPNFGTGSNDNVLAANQTITYPVTLPKTGSSQLEFLATATNADVATALPTPLDQASSATGVGSAPAVAPGTSVSGSYCFTSTSTGAFCPAGGTVNYAAPAGQAAARPTKFALNVPDWINGPPALAAVTLPGENTPTGHITTATGPKLYTFSVPVLAGQTIASITLPDVSVQTTYGGEALHIFAIATRDTTAVDPTSAAAWTGAWASPTEGTYSYGFQTNAAFANQTFRVAVKPSISGGKIRVKLDNALGTAPLDIGAATVAPDSNPNVPTPVTAKPGTTLTFGGNKSVTIPDGAMVYSDTLPFPVTANQYVLVSFYLRNGAASSPFAAVPDLVEHTQSDTGWEYIAASNTGDSTTACSGNTTCSQFSGTNGPFTNLVTDLDVTDTGGATAPGTTAVLGDGLIDPWQAGSHPLNQADLAMDLTQAEPSFPTPYGTISEGIEANQIIADNPETFQGGAAGGPAALSRIDRDILDQPGISTVIVDEGLEDLLTNHKVINPDTLGTLNPADTLDNAGYSPLFQYLENQGINVVIGIQLPACDGYSGTGANDPCTPTVDGYRTTVNSWLSNEPLGMGLANPNPPAYYFANTDAAVGLPYPNPDNVEVSLDPNAAMPDSANLSASGDGALTSGYLGPQDTWLLNDPALNPVNTTIATDTAQNVEITDLVTNLLAGSNDAPLSGGATFVADPIANDPTRIARTDVLQLDGSTGDATASGAVLATNASFSVSAWVDLTALPTNDADIISQDGTTNSGFALQYDAADQRWAFGMNTADTTGATMIRAKSQFAPTLNTWTHLVGIYNATTGSLALYVNGAADGTATDTSPYATPGPLAIGRGQTAGQTTGPTGDFFPGYLSDVQTWSYAITPDQVGALYQQVH